MCRYGYDVLVFFIRRHPSISRPRALSCVLLISLCVLASGCYATQEILKDDPLDALIAWQQALEEGRPDDAWRLLTPDARDGLSQSDFASLYAEQSKALQHRARTMLRWAREQQPQESAYVRVEGRVMRLVRTRDGWRIDGDFRPKQ